MPSLPIGHENTNEIINWFITVNSVYTNAYEIGYAIYDITEGIPGTQIFPETPGTWEDVTNAPGNFSTGSYYAYDNAEGSGYTPPITSNIGTHRIYWRWKITSTTDYQYGAEDFEILDPSSTSIIDTYITVQDVRNAGLSDANLFPDDDILVSIELWQSVIERICRQWFTPKTMLLNVDGTDSDTLHFGVPIIEIEYLKLNNSPSELDSSYYKVYNSLSYPDDRRNPRIKLVRYNEYRDIFTAPIQHGELRFRKGRKNQEIKGTFGYVESDLSVPRPIQRALLKLVVEKMTKPIYVGDPSTSPISPPPIIGTLLEEWTDGHRYKYSRSGAEVSKRSPYLVGITNDQEIIELLKMYRAPIGCATPAHPSYK